MFGWYERHIVPRIIRCGCGSEALDDYRKQVVPQAQGTVLELGVGAGANLPFYDATKVKRLVGIEPSPELRTIAARAERAVGLDVAIQAGEGENLEFEDASFDSIVCTFTLCSVTDPQRTLAEARRVLRPGGVLLFSEHGAAPDAKVARWQRRLDPLWSRFMGGCHITRNVRAHIEQHFAIDKHDALYQPEVPKLLGWMEWGRAVAR